MRKYWNAGKQHKPFVREFTYKYRKHTKKKWKRLRAYAITYYVGWIVLILQWRSLHSFVSGILDWIYQLFDGISKQIFSERTFWGKLLFWTHFLMPINFLNALFKQIFYWTHFWSRILRSEFSSYSIITIKSISFSRTHNSVCPKVHISKWCDEWLQ